MREIKFRAWDERQKVMLPFISVNHNGDNIGFDNDDYLKWAKIDELPDHIEAGDYDWSFLMEQFELMQYTGLKDKNGKEIYEGDILEKTNSLTGQICSRCVVWWHNPSARFNGLSFGTSRNQEVIGNIYENKELLGGN